MLAQRHRVLGCLHNVFSISAKNVLNYFIDNFILFLCFTYQKSMCYVSLEFPALKLRQGSTLIAHIGAMFFSLKMPVNFTQYRGTIGVTNPGPAQKIKANHFLSVIGILIVLLIMGMPKYHC